MIFVFLFSFLTHLVNLELFIAIIVVFMDLVYCGIICP